MPPKTALQQAAAALERHDRSAAGLRAYLEECGVDGGEARDAVERLRAAGYVDDERFAANRAAALAERGYGDEAIRADLAGRDVPAGVIETALASLEDEGERAKAALDASQNAAKAARRLLAKGFAPDSVEAALDAHRVLRERLL